MTPLLNCLKIHADNITPEVLTTMNFKISESLELPFVWLMSTSLLLVWEERLAGKRLDYNTFLAELLARLGILKKTKWKHFNLHNSALLLDEMINLHLN